MPITFDLNDTSKTDLYPSYITRPDNSTSFAAYKIYVADTASATTTLNNLIKGFVATGTSASAPSYAILQSVNISGSSSFIEISNHIGVDGTTAFDKSPTVNFYLNFFISPEGKTKTAIFLNLVIYKSSGVYTTSDVTTLGATSSYSIGTTTYTPPVVGLSLIIEVEVGIAPGNPCFPAKTPVLTNHGYVHIDEIDINNHTINNKAIVAVTQTVSDEKHLIRIAKNALDNNYPSETTLISQNHHVLFDDVMIKAKDLVGLVDKVTRVPYNGEPLYNVLLETHDQMQVNNMVVETLHPEHKIAQLYKLLKMAKPEQRGEIIALYTKLEREHKTAKK